MKRFNDKNESITINDFNCSLFASETFHRLIDTPENHNLPFSTILKLGILMTEQQKKYLLLCKNDQLNQNEQYVLDMIQSAEIRILGESRSYEEMYSDILSIIEEKYPYVYVS